MCIGCLPCQKLQKHSVLDWGHTSSWCLQWCVHHHCYVLQPWNMLSPQNSDQQMSLLGISPRQQSSGTRFGSDWSLQGSDPASHLQIRLKSWLDDFHYSWGQGWLIFVTLSSFHLISLPPTLWIFTLWAVVMLWIFIWGSRVIQYGLCGCSHSLFIYLSFRMALPQYFWNKSILLSVKWSFPPTVFPSQASSPCMYFWDHESVDKFYSTCDQCSLPLQ